MCKLVCKKVFIIISCLCLFLSAPMSVFAAHGNILFANVAYSPYTSVVNCYINPISYELPPANSTWRYPQVTNGASFKCNMILTSRNLSEPASFYPAAVNGTLYFFIPLRLHLKGNTNLSNISDVPVYYGYYLEHAVIHGADGTDFYGFTDSGSDLKSFTLGSLNSDTFSTPTDNFSIVFNTHNLYMDSYVIVEFTFSVYSNFPLQYVQVTTPVLNTPSISDLPSSVSTIPNKLDLVNQNLNGLQSEIDTTNNKLQNLTDGYDKSTIDNTNQQLGNNLDSFDQAEDAAIDSVKDYFNDIDQPIDFFNVGSFLTSNTFIWTYLQGLYEHLGDAKIVVNVVLALTVAFSFIGLGRYIWKAFDREDSS